MKNFALATAMILLGAPTHVDAAFEDRTADAISAAMGRSITAAPLGLTSIGSNPAGLGGLMHFQAETGYQRIFQTPAGKTDVSRISAGGAVPIGNAAAASLSGLYDSVRDTYLDRAIGATFATRNWKELDRGYLDFGVTANAYSRTFRPDGHHVLKPSADAGMLYRMGENQTFGVSLLNINRPLLKVDGISDRVPLTGGVGYAQVLGDFAMSIDVTKREPSMSQPASQSLAAGVQYWWNTMTGGSWAGRTGLNLSDKSRSAALGVGWRAFGAEADYSLVLPLTAKTGCGNFISLLFRFGEWNPEREFEKILDSEIRLRQDLSKVLERSEQKQKELTAEQEQLGAEIESLKASLAAHTAGEAEAREKLKRFEEKERHAREAMDRLEAERRAAAQKSKDSLYREDWAAFEKLKGQGAPDVTLIERLKQLLRQYKDSGVDLSEANKELLRLLRNRPAP